METLLLAAASWAAAAAKGTQPERVDAEFFVDPVDEVMCSARRKDDVLYDVMLCHAVFVEAVIEDLGVEEGIQSPAEQADEGDAEVREDVTARPESAAVITEEVVRCGYRFRPRAGRFVQDVADMEVVPGGGSCKRISYNSFWRLSKRSCRGRPSFLRDTWHARGDGCNTMTSNAEHTYHSSLALAYRCTSLLVGFTSANIPVMTTPLFRLYMMASTKSLASFAVSFSVLQRSSLTLLTGV